MPSAEFPAWQEIHRGSPFAVESGFVRGKASWRAACYGARMKALLLALLCSLTASVAAASDELPPPPPPPPGASEPAAPEPLPSERPLAPLPGPAPAPAVPPPPQPPPVGAVDAPPSAREALPPAEPVRRGTRRRFDHDPWLLSGVFGLASPVGYGGVLAGYSIHDRVELDAGLGIAGKGVPAFAINAHLRPLLWFSSRRQELQALTLDVGYSFSRYETSRLGVQGRAAFVDYPDASTYHLTLAHWFQYAFGWEMLTEHGYDLRGAFGLAIPTNAADAYCTNASGRTPCTSKLNPLPSLSFAVGHTF